MSDINPLDALLQDREALYKLVWREPAERIAAQYGISTTLLAKRCTEMRIPEQSPYHSERNELSFACY